MEPLKKEAVPHLTIALDIAINDKVLNLKSGETPTPGNCASKLAKQIREKIDSDVAANEIKEFANHIQELLLPSVNTDFCSDARQIGCTKFSLVATSTSGRNKFNNIIKSLKLKTDRYGFDILYTFLTTKIFSLILKWKNDQLIATPKVDYRSVQISQDEDKVLRYVSGFIPFALKKRFLRVKESPLRNAALQAVSAWCLEEEEADKTDFYDYTLSWTNRINRGGLMIVKESFFVFIRRVELSVRGILNQTLIKTYNGEDLRDTLFNRLMSDSLIESTWASLSRMILSNKLRATLKEIILKKWINLRIRSFVTAWIQAAKSKQGEEKLSKKGEVSLRKGLAQ